MVRTVVRTRPQVPLNSIKIQRKQNKTPPTKQNARDSVRPECDPCRAVINLSWHPHPWPSTSWACTNRLLSEHVITHVPGTALETLHMYFFPSSRGRHHFPHSAIEETASQNTMTCAGSCVREVAEARLEPWLAVSFPLCLSLGVHM